MGNPFADKPDQPGKLSKLVGSFWKHFWNQEPGPGHVRLPKQPVWDALRDQEIWCNGLTTGIYPCPLHGGSRDTLPKLFRRKST